MISFDKPRIKIGVICVVDSFRKKGDKEVCLSIKQKGTDLRGWFLESQIDTLKKEIGKVYKK